METNNNNNNKHIKSYWAIIAIAATAFIAGGLVVWAVYNTNLQEEGWSLNPTSRVRNLNR